MEEGFDGDVEVGVEDSRKNVVFDNVLVYVRG